MNNRIVLLLLILLVLGGGLSIGALTAPGEWYQGLNKPSFNPPGWVFGPVWTVLYVLIAVAGWLVWKDNRNGIAMKLWWGQLALNFLWSPAFFAIQQIGLAFMVIVSLLLVVVAFIVKTREEVPIASWLFMPYAVWVGFATVLNGTILTLKGNRWW